ncbi:uncharacterized protein LOC128557292 [Mercenaria mercenaria]|uniref:uncharacterized protein LOC128557292 n=1 Tax=Mercenaria mercenaria TaxID=6596 RepID=UPI00234E8737|nr:uncharacterized protein LOC128557292 [Mercenaria mercenaria]
MKAEKSRLPSTLPCGTPEVAGVARSPFLKTRYLADVLSPLVGKTEQHILNSKHFAEKIKNLEVPPVKKLVSYDVTALFTSIPVDKAIKVIKERLKKDNTLKEKSILSVDEITTFLEFVLNTTYFVYHGTFYKQKHGAAMGLPVSPIAANLYMEDFEQRAISTAECPPELWFRYVDDMFTKMSINSIDSFTDHINSIDDEFKFTSEPEENDHLPYLDTDIYIKDDGSTKVKIYRKQTHTVQYLNFGSNHYIQHKRSVVRTLMYRAENIVSEPEDIKVKKHHISEALKVNGYKNWMLKIREQKDKNKEKKNSEKKRKEKKKGNG